MGLYTSLLMPSLENEARERRGDVSVKTVVYVKQLYYFIYDLIV
jgi:hypothetical protein